ncbi:MAG: type VI secretion protein [Acidocella sp. 20-57-95]|nr:MAG: type VI secretion protein [Acidocella sp. 20-57-95]OYV59151.1 MAG: type VI secretion protein [Acidocella sp. 21-58-7]
MFANTQMMGMDPAIPDVLLTPPLEIPVPFPNVGMRPIAIPTQFTVFIMAMPAHNMMTEIPLTITGVGLGVASGMDMGPSRNLTGAFTILLEGAPATRLTSMSLNNLTNAPGASLVPSQPTVLFLAP